MTTLFKNRSTKGLGPVLRVLGLAVAVSLAAAPAPAQSEPRTGLTLYSQAGDYVGQGSFYRYDYCPTYPIFFTQARDLSGDGVADFVEIDYGPGIWRLVFSTADLGHAIEPGVYENAHRPGQVAGAAGLDIGGGPGAAGCNMLDGRFTIHEVDIDHSNRDGNGNPTLIRFSASFEQHCEGAQPALVGTVRYNALAELDEEPPVVSNITPSKTKINVFKKDRKITVSWDATDNDRVVSYNLYYAPDAATYFLIGVNIPADVRDVVVTFRKRGPATDKGVFLVTAVDASANVGLSTADGPVTVLNRRGGGAAKVGTLDGVTCEGYDAAAPGPDPLVPRLLREAGRRKHLLPCADPQR
jgi:hypothetical protein